MDVAKRQFVEDMYDGPRWRQKVRKMSDSQVFAIYMREQKKQEAEAAAEKAKKTQPKDDIPF